MGAHELTVEEWDDVLSAYVHAPYTLSVCGMVEIAGMLEARAGFRDPGVAPETPLEWIGKLGLVTTEVAEAMEAIRKPDNQDAAHIDGLPLLDEELADVVIRVAAIAEARGINLASAVAQKLQFNSSRMIRHGKVC